METSDEIGLLPVVPSDFIPSRTDALGFCKIRIHTEGGRQQHYKPVRLNRSPLKPLWAFANGRPEHRPEDWNNRLIFVPHTKTAEGRRMIPMSDRVGEVLRIRTSGCTKMPIETPAILQSV
jgi:hypothetical protein